MAGFTQYTMAQFKKKIILWVISKDVLFRRSGNFERLSGGCVPKNKITEWMGPAQKLIIAFKCNSLN